MTEGPQWLIRRLGQGDLPALRLLRLEALRAHPEAFGVTAEEEAQEDTARLVVAPPGIMLGGFAVGRLIACAGFMVSHRIKQRHKGQVFGFYVAPAWRGTGIGDGLLAGLIAEGRATNLRTLMLSVTVGNTPARFLYRRNGFQAYGIEPDGLNLAGTFYDLEFMALNLEQNGSMHAQSATN